jgi:hypothetical protein
MGHTVIGSGGGMHQTQILRILISIDAFCTAVGVLSESLLAEEIPAPLRAAYAEAFPVENISLALFMLALLIMLLVGYAGMWRLKQWGRLAYTTACAVDIACLAFYQPILLSGPAFALAIVTAFSAGALLAMAWLSDLRREFS